MTLNNKSILLTIMVLGLSILTISSISFLGLTESFSQPKSSTLQRIVQTLTYYLQVHLILDPSIQHTTF
jgi:type IV secretory pathway VirB2 component (pilin)